MKNRLLFIGALFCSLVSVTGCGSSTVDRNGYDITFDAGIGEFSDGTKTLTEHYFHGQFVTEPERPTADGYYFDSWKTDAGSVWDFSKMYVTSNVTITASYAISNATKKPYIDGVVTEDDGAFKATVRNATDKFYISDYFLVDQFDSISAMYSDGSVCRDGSALEVGDNIRVVKVIGNDGGYKTYSLTITRVRLSTIYYRSSDMKTTYGVDHADTGFEYFPNCSASQTGYNHKGWSLNGTDIITSFVPRFEEEALLAVFEPKTIAITLDTQGGEVSTKQIAVKYGDKYTLPTPTRENYVFDGWYYGDEKMTGGICRFTSNITFKAKWIGHFVFLDAEYPKCTVEGSGRYEYGKTFTIKATPATGYSFVGWFQNDVCVSKDTTYSATMPGHDVRFEARVTIKVIEIKVSYDDTMGSVSGMGTFNYGDNVTLTATPYDEDLVDFKGFYRGSTRICNAKTFSFSANDWYEGVVIEAVFEKKQYTVSISLGPDSVCTTSGSGKYHWGDEVLIKIYTGSVGKGYYIYQDDELLSSDASYSFVMPTHDVFLTVKTYDKQFTVTLSANIPEAGTVSGGGTYNFGTNVTLIARPIYPYVFTGWYEGNKCWGMNEKLSLCVSAYNLSLEARFKKIDPSKYNVGSSVYFGRYPMWEVDYRLSPALYQKLDNYKGTLPTEEDSGTWTSYGFYPLSKATDYAWYKDIDLNGDGRFDYRGVYFTMYRPKAAYYTNSDKSDSSQDEWGFYTTGVYWFEYADIEWLIVEKNDKNVLLLSKRVLDSHEFSIPYYNEYIESTDYLGNTGKAWKTSYQYSTIRGFLNTKFINTAFDDNEKSNLAGTPFAGDDGTIINDDKVTILSKTEAEQLSSEFLDTGETKNTVSSYYGCLGGYHEKVWWWTSESSGRGVGIYDCGSNKWDAVDNYRTDVGVRPALRMSIA